MTRYGIAVSIIAALTGTAAAQTDPAAPRIAYGQLKLEHGPSIGMLHHSLDGVDLPAGGMEVRVDCMFDTQRGGLGPCQSLDGKVKYFNPSNDGSPIKAALMRVMQMQFAPLAVAPGAPTRVQVEIPIKLSPSERLKAGEPVKVRKASEVNWKRAPLANNLYMHFPLHSLTQPVTLTTTCQIQKDLSLVCSRAAFAPEGEAEVLKKKNPFLLSYLLTSEPTLNDGSPAAGTWVSVEYGLEPTAIVVGPPKAN